MRVLVTWGSKRGGTEGIARTLAEALEREGVDVLLLPPRDAARAKDVDAVVVGGALYANRWHAAARRFVSRNEERLRTLPTWFFSSGPLDDSAAERVVPPVRQVAALMARVGAQGHATFGGRLAPDARGFPARAMAKEHAGDFRRTERIAAWASEIARALPTASPKTAAPLEGASLARLLAHGVLAWASCAGVMAALLATTSQTAAFTIHAVAAPVLFAVVARSYFRAPGARGPAASALTFAVVTALLDGLVVAGLVERSPALFASVAAFWLPLALGFLSAWATGEIAAMTPLSRPPSAGSKPAVPAPAHAR